MPNWRLKSAGRLAGRGFGEGCRRGGSNPHGTKYRGILSPVRLPVPPLRLAVANSSPSTHPESIARHRQTHFVKRDIISLGWPDPGNLCQITGQRPKIFGSRPKVRCFKAEFFPGAQPGSIRLGFDCDHVFWYNDAFPEVLWIFA